MVPVFGYSVLFFHSFCLFEFSLRKFLRTYLQALPTQETSKTFISATVFLIFNTYVWCLDRLSLWLYYPFVFACCLLFLLESLAYYSYYSKSLSHNSKIYVLIWFWCLLCLFCGFYDFFDFTICFILVLFTAL